jgi:transcriptional regulator with XRE-family HTH domain
VKKSIGERLKEAREARGLTLYQLSQLTGIAYPTLGTYEQDNGAPRLPKLARICKVLNISLDWVALGCLDDDEDYEMF